MLTVQYNLVCLLAGFPQEGYDRPGNLPETVQVRRISRVRLTINRRDISDMLYFRVGDIVDIKANGAVQKG